MSTTPRLPELKACPFCGAEPKLIDREEGPLLRGAFVICDECKTSNGICTTSDEAVAAWNRRSLPDPLLSARGTEMSTRRLPELPEPKHIDDIAYNSDTAYTADQLHAYGLAAWKAAMQCAMEVCDEHANKHRARSGKAHAKGRVFAAEDIAQDLARLPLPEQGSPQ